MVPRNRTFDLRTAILIGGATLLGAAWALFNLARVGGDSASGATSALVWTVFGTPFFAFWGWLLARPREGWLAAFVCFCIYFFAIFLGARLELLIQGNEGAAANEHALYFRLTVCIQLLACIVVAAYRAGSRGTMQIPTKT